MGRPPYQAALRLCVLAQDRWAEVDAAYLQADLVRLPYDRFLNAVYTFFVKSLVDPNDLKGSQERKEEFDMILDTPIGDETSSGTFTDEQEADSFMSAFGGAG